MSKITKANTLQVEVSKGTSQEAAMAMAANDAVNGNAMTAKAYRKGSFGELDLTESVRVLKQTTKRVNDGNLQDLEATLTAQANTLDAIFNETARRAALNMGEYLSSAETYLRLALKAQTQCRATIETLATIKNPPVVFTRNANIVNGNQQVNQQPLANSLIGEIPESPARETLVAPSFCRPFINGSTPAHETLEHHHATTLDTGAPTAPARANSDLEALEQINRPTKRKRQN